MERGRSRRRIKRSHFGKALVLAACTAVLCMGAAGGTFAWLMTGEEAAENRFQPGRVSCAVEEEAFDGEKKENVTVQNTGNTKAYIRARVFMTWKNQAGEVYGKAPKEEDYEVSYGRDLGWTEQDGYWYYENPVAPGESTRPLITSCTRTRPEGLPEGYDLSVEIIADAIQSEPVSAVVSAWAYTPAGN